MLGNAYIWATQRGGALRKRSSTREALRPLGHCYFAWKCLEMLTFGLPREVGHSGGPARRERRLGHSDTAILLGNAWKCLTDRQTERQTDRQADRHPGRQPTREALIWRSLRSGKNPNCCHNIWGKNIMFYRSCPTSPYMLYVLSTLSNVPRR